MLLTIEISHESFYPTNGDNVHRWRLSLSYTQTPILSDSLKITLIISKVLMFWKYNIIFIVIRNGFLFSVNANA